MNDSFHPPSHRRNEGFGAEMTIMKSVVFFQLFSDNFFTPTELVTLTKGGTRTRSDHTGPGETKVTDSPPLTPTN